MITLRMVGIAVAILVVLPIGVVVADELPTIPGGEVARAQGEAYATVENITLIEAPRRYDRVLASNMPEQIVEGHSVFATIEIPRVLNESRFTVSIVGDVHCWHNVTAEGFFLGVIPVPNRVDRIQAGCTFGETVFVTPNPFMDPNGAALSVTPFVPTTRWTALSPSGEEIDVQEFEFEAVHEEWDGSVRTETLYAWSVPLTHSWLHSDGRVMSWFLPIPEGRLAEMGKTDFWAYHESELPAHFWSGTD